MPTLASGRLVSLGCYELINAMLVRKPLLVGRTILKQAGGGFIWEHTIFLGAEKQL